MAESTRQVWSSALWVGPAQLASSSGPTILSVLGLDQYQWGKAAVFSVAVKGYGIVIWDGNGSWRTFGPTDTLSAMLAARVEYALQTVPAPADEREAREALLAIAGAGLLSIDCDHAPGECDGEDGAS
jgi:hypothetical protein